MPLDPRRLMALFGAALRLEDPADRAAFLDEACGDDGELRARIDRLLFALDQPATALAAPFLADFALGDTVAVPSGPTVSQGEQRAELKGESGPIDYTSPIGTTIAGRYKIRQEIGEGGMGSVYLAEQFQPVKRMVALKLIKPGMDTRTVLARFDSERQALAIMDHPHIAHVLDAGTTERGHPFFVMDLVKGIPLTNYCDQHRLGLPERLELFRQICSAVQHAHQKGIIHRDLKPTNILVENHDGIPVPKVIDFGLAKATSGMQLSEQSLFTAFGSITGTPLYMAPEQATFNAIDVDTRADIYALGVILYELLTGSTPIRRESLHNAELDEILRVVREDEPPKPSHRISTSEGLPSLSANRHIEPARLGRFLRGDLDWIVMKALAKERNRRYDSATGLANDIERFLNNEAVTAGPPTAGYRTRKFIRRHRGQVVAAGLVLLALVGGVVGTTLGLFEAKRQEREARRQGSVALAESIEKEKARQSEADQRRQAELRLGQIEKANDILGSIFKDLNPRNAEKEGKPLAALLGERLDQATAAIEGESIGDPVAVARMQQTLGQSQLGLGYPRRAIALFAKARETLASKLGPDHPDTLVGMESLALAYADVDQFDRALPLLERTLTVRTGKLGPDHPDTLTNMGRLAWVYKRSGQVARALSLLEQTVTLQKGALGINHSNTLNSMGQLGLAYTEAGQVDRALPLLEQTVELQKAKLGPDHPNTLLCMGYLALAYLKADQVARALSLLEQTVTLQKARLGPDHPQTVSNRDQLAWIYKNTRIGRLHRDLITFEQTLALQRATLTLEHLDIRGSLAHLASTYRNLGRSDEAVEVHTKRISDLDQKYGPEHDASLLARDDLATEYWYQNRNADMIPVRLATLKVREAKLGPDHPETLDNLRKLAGDYKDAGRFFDAIECLERLLKATEAKFGSDHRVTLGTRLLLANAYEAADQPDRALTILLEISTRRQGSKASTLAEILALQALCLLRQGKWAEAEPVARENLAIHEREAGDGWPTFDAKAMLGGALLGQKKYDEARPLLIAGFEGMKQRSGGMVLSNRRVRLSDALDRLIALAEATGRPDEAKAWREEKARISPPPVPAPKPEAGKP